MKRLYLIRHAKSSWSDPSVSDFFRKLNKRGKRDAPFMAEKLAARGTKPDIIISSPAKRAKKTARFMAKGVGYPVDTIVYDETIYTSSTMDLYRVLHSINDTHSTAFFIGHNYAITDLAEELISQQLVNIPTSGIVSMDCAISSWKEIGPGCGTLLFFDYPKMYSELR